MLLRLRCFRGSGGEFEGGCGFSMVTVDACKLPPLPLGNVMVSAYGLRHTHLKLCDLDFDGRRPSLA